MIEGGNHLVFIEHGKETAAVLDKFLASISQGDEKAEPAAADEQDPDHSQQESVAEPAEAVGGLPARLAKRLV